MAGEISNGASEQEAGEVAKRFAGHSLRSGSSNVRSGEPRAGPSNSKATASQEDTTSG